MVLTVLVRVAGPLLAAAGVFMAVCLLVVMLAPAVTVLGYEARGNRHIAEDVRADRVRVSGRGAEPAVVGRFGLRAAPDLAHSVRASATKMR